MSRWLPLLLLLLLAPALGDLQHASSANSSIAVTGHKAYLRHVSSDIIPWIDADAVSPLRTSGVTSSHLLPGIILVETVRS